MSFELGQTVGNYRIMERLGAGGMGEVFLAEHPLIGKTVALKVIHQDLARNKELVARFINEAKAVSTIGNDHIVEVHDFGVTEEGAHFFIMEHLEGRTLGDAMADGSLAQGPPEQVSTCLHIAAQIAAGLDAAHRHNIIHRDLKPDNVMLIHKLGDPDFVKILDFGLAKMLESEAKLTATGVVLGTPEFMSPEAAESKEIDGRSDIYSCGVLLFLMLTGQLPFSAKSMGEMMVQHVCKAPPVPRGLNPQISPAVEQIVLRCLAKRREDRFQTMHGLREALMDPEGYLSGGPQIMHSDGAPGGVSKERSAARHPAMARPAQSAPRTMHIGTPVGFARASRRRLGTLVAIAFVAGGGGVAAALAQDASSDELPALEGDPLEQDVSELGVSEHGSSGQNTLEHANPPVKASASEDFVVIKITSEPNGAEVVNEDGLAMGTTPFVHEMKSGHEVSWQFQRAGYSPMMYRFTPAGPDPLIVTLVRLERSKTARRPESRRSNAKSPNGSRRNNKKPAKVENNLLTPDL